MKHTAGPWEAHYSESPHRTDGFYYVEAKIFDRGNGRGNVCDMLNQHHCIDPDTSRANASLIAAAPELLAALELLINGLQWRIENTPTEINESDHEAIATARAAVAKAEGRAT